MLISTLRSYVEALGGHWSWSYISLGVPLSRLTDFLRRN